MSTHPVTRFDTTTHIGVSVCPQCGAPNDYATGDTQPKPGDAVICFKCARVATMDEAGGLREPTVTEQLDFDSDMRILELRALILGYQSRYKKASK